MKIYIGADHRGFDLKEEIKVWLMENGTTGVDVGAFKKNDGDDYVEYAADVASRVVQKEDYGHETRGIVICGSGVGVDIVANKIKDVRCGLGISAEQVKTARSDDDINILSIASDHTTEQEAKAMIKAFLETPFSNEERHKRRIQKISDYEAAHT